MATLIVIGALGYFGYRLGTMRIDLLHSYRRVVTRFERDKGRDRE